MVRSFIALLLFFATSLAYANPEISYSYDEYHLDDEYLSFDRGEGIPGISFGYKFDKITNRLTYVNGDVWVAGTNVQAQSLRYDIEYDIFTVGRLTPYGVLGAHDDLDYKQSKDLSATTGSAGFGFKLELLNGLVFSADHRVLVDDLIGNDSEMTAIRLTAVFGGTRASAPVLPSPVEPAAPIKVDPEKTIVRVFFQNNSTELSQSNKELLELFFAELDSIVDGKVLVSGHASAPGTEVHNTVVSAARTKAVKQYIESLNLPFVSVVVPAYYGEDRATGRDSFDRRADVIVNVL